MGINKIVGSFEEAVADIFDGAVILVGGIGSPGGCPSYLLRALRNQGAKDLTLVCNVAGLGKDIIQMMSQMMRSLMAYPDWYEDQGILIENKQVKKVICSFPVVAGLVTPFEKQLLAHEVEVELVPMGTLAERIRAGKAGIPAFYTNVGIGTAIEKGKEIKVINGQTCSLEHSIKGDFALIWGYKGDRYGNLVYRGTGRNFNATMAGAANATIAEVEEVVGLGDLNPEVIVTPGLYVDRVIQRLR